MKSIAFIVPYFGRFNNYFSFWLESCRYNSTVDWIVLTDNKDLYDWPDNVHVVKTTLDAFRQKFDAKLGMQVSLEKPYKLCDLRPAYGYVFEDMIGDFDFWGWCDVDLIWGDIRNLLKDEMLEGQDMISRWGHCTLLRNTNQMRKLFMNRTQTRDGGGITMPAYTEAFASPINYIFDETTFLMCAMEAGLHIRHIEGMHYDCSINHYDFYPADHQSGYLQSLGHDIFRYRHGHLSLLTSDGSKEEEYPLLYAHFQKRRMQIETNHSDDYLITDHSFIDYNNVVPIAAADIARLSPKPLIDFTPQKRFLQRFRRRLFPGKDPTFYHMSPELTALKDKIWQERYLNRK